MYAALFSHKRTNRGVEQRLTFHKLDPANIEKVVAAAREMLATMAPDDPERAAIEDLAVFVITPAPPG
jgi:N-acetylglucosamine-6-phosphate deacetylase